MVGHPLGNLEAVELSAAIHLDAAALDHEANTRTCLRRIIARQSQCGNALTNNFVDVNEVRSSFRLSELS
jgi:hypothetical protein